MTVKAKKNSFEICSIKNLNPVNSRFSAYLSLKQVKMMNKVKMCIYH